MHKKVTITDILSLHASGIIGKIESRNWLAQEYRTFKKSRRKDVDEWLEKMGTDAQQELELNNEFEEEFDE